MSEAMETLRKVLKKEFNWKLENGNILDTKKEKLKKVAKLIPNEKFSFHYFVSQTEINLEAILPNFLFLINAYFSAFHSIKCMARNFFSCVTDS